MILTMYINFIEELNLTSSLPSNIISQKLDQPVTYCIYKVICKYPYQETTLIGESGDTVGIGNKLQEHSNALICFSYRFP